MNCPDRQKPVHWYSGKRDRHPRAKNILRAITYGRFEGVLRCDQGSHLELTGMRGSLVGPTAMRKIIAD